MFHGDIKKNLFQSSTKIKKCLGVYEETKFCSSRIKPLKYDYKPFINHIKKIKIFFEK